MRIEHIGYMVEQPAEVAKWYGKVFGFNVIRKFNNDADAHFIADESGQVIFEVYNNKNAEVPDYKSMNPLVLHLAFKCDEISNSVAMLVENGATVVDEPFTTEAGDELAMLRDPWGFSIQLCNRAKDMI